MASVTWPASRRLGPGSFLGSPVLFQDSRAMSKTCVPVFLCTQATSTANKLQRLRRLPALQRDSCCSVVVMLISTKILARASTTQENSLWVWLWFATMPRGASYTQWTTRSGPCSTNKKTVRNITIVTQYENHTLRTSVSGSWTKVFCLTALLCLGSWIG